MQLSREHILLSRDLRDDRMQPTPKIDSQPIFPSVRIEARAPMITTARNLNHTVQAAPFETALKPTERASMAEAVVNAKSNQGSLSDTIHRLWARARNLQRQYAAPKTSLPHLPNRY